eukprot:123187-Pyramimonas_sp.AAC.1
MGWPGRLGGQFFKPPTYTCKSTAKVPRTIYYFVMSAGLTGGVHSCAISRKAPVKPRWPAVVKFRGEPLSALVQSPRLPRMFPQDVVIGRTPVPQDYGNILEYVRSVGDRDALGVCYRAFVESLERGLGTYHGALEQSKILRQS